MADVCDEEAVLLENLRDAGCDCQMLEECIMLYRNHTSKQLLMKLQDLRGSLLTKIHAEQDKLDCLDYLIYKIKKEDCHK